MKRLVLYLAILMAPFVIMISFNEFNRPDQPYVISSPFFNSQAAYNTDHYIKDKCTWHCHNYGCKHPKMINNSTINDLYFGIIGANKMGNGYISTTLITLVLIWPLGIFLLIVLNIQLYIKRRRHD
jgi:hypothetical protein